MMQCNWYSNKGQARPLCPLISVRRQSQTRKENPWNEGWQD